MILTKNVKYRGRMIPVCDLKENSTIKIKVQCPICKKIREVAYRQIIRNEHCMCNSCAIRKKQSKSLEVDSEYGKWKVVAKGSKGGFSVCKCYCGTVKEVNNYSLEQGRSQSCGCVSVEANKQRRKYLKIGKTYGRLTVIEHSKVSGHSVCRCECGNKCTALNSRLKNGETQSCGCLQKEMASKHLQRVNEANAKENHWNWQGGISEERHAIMSTKEYKDWRTEVFKRDNYTCVKCSQHGGKLRAHHIFSFSKHPKLRTNLDNGITFCEECHREFHSINGFDTNEEQIKIFLK